MFVALHSKLDVALPKTIECQLVISYTNRRRYQKHLNKNYERKQPKTHFLKMSPLTQNFLSRYAFLC